MRKLFFLFLVFCLSIGGALALPTTMAAFGNDSMNVTFKMSGATAPCWFEYGVNPSNPSWHTINISQAGTVTINVSGMPFVSNNLYYYRACDTTGCGSIMSVFMNQAQPIAQTTYGQAEYNISESKFSVDYLPQSFVSSYLWASTATVFWSMIFLFMYAGLWLRQREVLIPAFLGLIGGFLILYTGANSIGLAPEFVAMAQGITYASLAGVIFGLFKK
jgi:hypothetical protein